jgi:hypothetical protein
MARIERDHTANVDQLRSTFALLEVLWPHARPTADRRDVNDIGMPSFGNFASARKSPAAERLTDHSI